MIPIRPQYVTRALLVVLIAAFVFTILHPSNAALAVGEPAPDFALKDLSGATVQLSSFRGKIVVVNFWATWCPPCVEEMPSLQRFQETFANRGVVVLTVSVDDDEDALRRFVSQHGLKLAVVRDPGRKTSTEYRTYQYPETYIVDRQGRLMRKIAGPEDWTSTPVLNYFSGIL